MVVVGNLGIKAESVTDTCSPESETWSEGLKLTPPEENDDIMEIPIRDAKPVNIKSGISNASTGQNAALTAEFIPRKFLFSTPLFSQYLNSHQIAKKSSTRKDFVRKWNPESSDEAFPRSSKHIKDILQALKDSLPARGKRELRDSIRRYWTQHKEEQFAEDIHSIVDNYSVIISLHDGNHRAWRTQMPSVEGGHTDKTTKKRKQSSVKTSPRTGPKTSITSGKVTPTPKKEARIANLSKLVGGTSRSDCVVEGSSSDSHSLRDTSLSLFLTEKARKLEPPLNVKVVGQRVGGSGENHHECKAIFAFQQVADRKETIVMALYCHEYGRKAQPPNVGRIYIECIDGIPLRHGETGLYREKVMTNVLFSYLDFVKMNGFSYVHLRVPPPNDENHQIFARKPSDMKVQATIRQKLWFNRIFKSAVSERIIHSFSSGSHGMLENYPSSVLPALHLLTEMIFSEREGEFTKQTSPSSAKHLQERLFVLQLHDSDHQRTPEDSEDDVIPETFATCRRELISVLVQERCSFHTLNAASKSTRRLVQKLVQEQEATISVGVDMQDDAQILDPSYISVDPWENPQVLKLQESGEGERIAITLSESQRAASPERNPERLSSSMRGLERLGSSLNQVPSIGRTLSTESTDVLKPP